MRWLHAFPKGMETWAPAGFDDDVLVSLPPSLPIPYCQITLDNGDWSDLACRHPSSGQFLDTENQVQIRM
jgi:hypothetical protein